MSLPACKKPKSGALQEFCYFGRKSRRHLWVPTRSLPGRTPAETSRRMLHGPYTSCVQSRRGNPGNEELSTRNQLLPQDGLSFRYAEQLEGETAKCGEGG